MADIYAGRFYEAIFDPNSQLIKNGVFQVYTDAGATTLATLYTDRTASASPGSAPTSNSNGMLQFFALPGVYYLKNVASGNVQEITVNADNADIATQSDLTTEATARSTGDTNTLNSAHSYADTLFAGAYPLQENQSVTSGTGAYTLPDLNLATVHRRTLTGNNTLTFPAPPSSNAHVKSFTLIAIQDATGGRTITWPGNVKWAGATAPTLSTGANKIDVLVFTCSDATNYLGSAVGLDFR